MLIFPYQTEKSVENIENELTRLRLKVKRYAQQ